MFLYDWLPLLRRKRLFQRLARADVTVRQTTETRADPGQAPPI
jgi:hypothetical protein